MHSIHRLAILISMSVTLLISCTEKPESLISEQDIYPWCIVAFDSLERSPVDRIRMLQKMDFDRYAYDCDIKYLDGMAEELQLAHEKNIEVTAVWLWLNAKRDSIGKLSPRNQRIFEIVEASAQRPEFWVSFSPNFFEKLGHDESQRLAANMLRHIHSKADSIDAGISIYNHKGWFGDIDNMVQLVETLPELEMGIVYNFHHGHQDIIDFPRVAKKIAPYLSTVNINGMRKGGPKILALGEGDHEKEMIQILQAEGFVGPWGILGHIREEDVRVVLERNLSGLKSL